MNLIKRKPPDTIKNKKILKSLVAMLSYVVNNYNTQCAMEVYSKQRHNYGTLNSPK